ncbi:MAG TPA: biosynthetic-type acetolactate synthase large subunit, partial [Candidatus Atribacteria bacterium]|nr:biosynthetic-type acetolactate synthase large subunit [Candidatus Atribacteria bacterium]
IKDLARVVREAFYIARTGRPGPVLIDFPKDIQLAQTEFKYPKKVYLNGYKPTFSGNVKQIKAAVQEIKNAQRPIIYAGGGVISSNAFPELKDFVLKTNIPITTTLMGLGCFPETHPLSLGMLGMHGTAYANYAISAADLIIALGVRFDDRITGKLDEFALKAKIIHIDIDPAEVGKNILVDIPIVGDIKNILEKLNKYILKKKETEWLNMIKDLKRKYPLKYINNEELKPQYIMETISKIAKDNTIIVTSVGQHQMWAAQYYQYTEPRSFISSGGLGTMGYGFPAALGAKMGCPEKTVICISGDGSFQMNQQEIATAVNNKLAITVIIMNNGYLGMVRQWQELFFDKRYAETTLNSNPDFVKLVEAYGGTGIRVNKKQELYPALERAISLNRFVLIDCLIPKEENVFPMVAPGSPISKMIGVE